MPTTVLKGTGYCDPKDPNDGWVRKVNALADKMDDICYNLHPACWNDQTADLKAKFRKVIADSNGASQSA